ncbi:MAG TPA: hypothetical protein VHU92_12455 [Streptosporangiaceae bacterium]|jgi:hypothetical protein|nr:hypothetical protein [Streptosporangiaceae bacterium]
MPGLQTQSPWQLLLDLLLQDPHAQSVLSEASHRDKLAIESAEALGQLARDVRTARRRWEELRHWLDPRGRRSLRIAAGTAALALVGGGLLWLGLLELSGLAPCATVIWLTTAWRAAQAERDGEQRRAGLIIAGSAGVSLLLGAAHLLACRPSHGSQLAVSLVEPVLIVALIVAARGLIMRTEPAVVAVARGDWRQAERRYRRATRQCQRDARLASAAVDAWLGLARRHSIENQQGSAEDGDAEFVAAVVKAAAALCGARIR